MSLRLPLIQPLGECAVLVRFSDALEDDANALAVNFARRLEAAAVAGVVEVVPNLVSVLARYDPAVTDFAGLAGDIRLLLSAAEEAGQPGATRRYDIVTRYGGEAGPDLDEVASLLGMTADAFVAAHAGADLRVLATGFAPGFVYCGFHAGLDKLNRRTRIRPQVPAGTILFAAGQTAITATPLPTGWHVIGHTDFVNFDSGAEPPTVLQAGDQVGFPKADR